MTLRLTEVIGEMNFGINMQIYLNVIIDNISLKYIFACYRVLLHKIWSINGCNYKANLNKLC